MHKRIDVLNIGLIVLSLVIAVSLPFKLFLFSYAFLGPLHYLTEINWLKEKNYFVKANSKWVRFFIVLTALICIYPFYKIIDLGLGSSWEEMTKYVFGKRKIIVLSAFFFSIALLLFKKRSNLILALFGSFALAIVLFYFLPKWLFILGLFLPTIIHVYLFTLLFMLYGNIKSKSKFGYAAAGLLILVPFIIGSLNIEPSGYMVTKETATAFGATGFLKVNSLLTEMFGGLINGKFQVMSVIGLKIQVFIAFAYTYHYLNWFSKTNIIGWKETLTRRNTIYIVVIWMAAVGIYLYDFTTGLIALYFLSLLHVLFEFPLNIVTIKELFKFRQTQS
ncbi:MAG: hypothetical protein K0U54_10060 [Bacteroidetes bacterium]|nr:hypothetical protein [Bacteroidota bacterium]